MSQPTSPLSPDSEAGRALARDLTDILARNQLAIDARKAREVEAANTTVKPRRAA